MELTVLIVDDEKVFRNYIRQMDIWRKDSFQIAGEARNTEEAMNFLGRQKVDVVILDVSMPGKNGVVLSEMIAGMYPHTAMIAVSSYDDYDYVREILKNGAHDYILKSRLSEGLLLRTLTGIAVRRERQSPWDVKKELRQQAADWILGSGISPFTSDNSRKAAAIVWIVLLKQYTEEGKNALMDGIGRIFESGGGTEQTDILALYCPPDRFVLLYRFYDEISEARMQERIANSQMISRDSIRRVYGVQVKVHNCPAFFSDKALRSFVCHKLDEKKEERTAASAPLAMTIGQQKKLLAAVERLDGEEAERQIQEIYAQIPPDGEALCIMVTKEMLDLLERISVEFQISLDFLPKNYQLFEYTREKNRAVLSASISGLFANVLREICEKTNHGRYSAIVNAAVEYMKVYYHEPISLSKIAESIGVNNSYLSRIFHEETQMTITEFLNRIRVEQAGKLLEEDIPMKDIVYRCGFRSYAYFLKIFKEYTKKTPKEFLAEK